MHMDIGWCWWGGGQNGNFSVAYFLNALLSVSTRLSSVDEKSLENHVPTDHIKELEYLWFLSILITLKQLIPTILSNLQTLKASRGQN